MTSSAGQRRQEKLDPSQGKDDNKLNPPNPTSKNTASSNTCQSDSTVLEELRKLQKDNQDGHNHIKLALGHVEQSISDIEDQLVEHKDRMEERISTAEDTEMRHRRALRYLLHCDIELLTQCDDLQNRL